MNPLPHPRIIATQVQRLEAIARIEAVPKHARTPDQVYLLGWLARKVKEAARGRTR